MGLFISFEGGEATGKTIQARLLRNQLMELGVRCILVHEPGDTRLGDRLKDLVKGDLSMTYEAELFLFSAARAELVSRVIKPKLAKQITIIADRYMDSTIAYQGYGRGIELEQVKAINAISSQGIMPNLTILLDMDPEDALKRRASQYQFAIDPCFEEALVRIDTGGQSKFENAPKSFHRRVRRGYLKLAEEEPQRWLVVDAGQPVEVVREIIWTRVQTLLSLRSQK